MTEFDPTDISATSFPEISSYKESNTGIDYIHCRDSGQPGKAVLVSGIIHGNEVCGVHAVKWLLDSDIKPERGRLYLAFMNVAAYEAFEKERPLDNRYVDEDMNRVWDAETLEGDRQSVELNRAREVRPIIDQVDMLLDLHSMSQSPVPLSMAGFTDKGKRLAVAIGIPEWVILDTGHVAGTRMRDYSFFGSPQSERVASLIECGAHFASDSGIIAKHASARFLNESGLFDKPVIVDEPFPLSKKCQKFVEVTGPYTVQTEKFRFTLDLQGLEVLENKGTEIARDGEKSVTTPYDNCVMIMPNGYKKPGETALRFGKLIGRP